MADDEASRGSLAKRYVRRAREYVRRLTRGRVPARVSYIVCSTPRSGSDRLAGDLWQTGLAGRPGQFFRNWIVTGDPASGPGEPITQGAVPPEAFGVRVLEQATTRSSGVAGVTTTWEHLAAGIERLKTIPAYRELDAAAILAQIFPNLRYVYLTRRDKVAQAVAWAWASQSGEWCQSPEDQSRPETPSPSSPPAYDFEKIAYCHRRVRAQETAWEEFFERSGIRPYRVAYEDCAHSWETATRDLLRHLDVSHHPKMGRGQVQTERTRRPQADTLIAQWADRFCEELPRVTEAAARPARYMICATPRSGSGFLAHWLWSTGEAGNPDEYFQYWWTAAYQPTRVQELSIKPWILDRADYMAKLRKEATTPNGVLAIKVMQDHVDVAIDNLVALYPQYRRLPPHEVFDRVFPGIKYVLITRRDKVRQAVSWAKASQRDEWFLLTPQPEGFPPEPVYDFALIDSYYRDLMRQERRWEAFFSAAQVSPFRVVYEEFVSRPEPIARELLGWVGVWPEHPLVFHSGPRRAPQRDGVDEQWARRFIADRAASRAPRTTASQ